MHDPQELRDLARKCRAMMNISLRPSVSRQLWLWTAELADYADEIERCSEGSPVSNTGSEKGELT